MLEDKAKENENVPSFEWHYFQKREQKIRLPVCFYYGPLLFNILIQFKVEDRNYSETLHLLFISLFSWPAAIFRWPVIPEQRDNSLSCSRKSVWRYAYADTPFRKMFCKPIKSINMFINGLCYRWWFSDPFSWFNINGLYKFSFSFCPHFINFNARQTTY